MKTFASMLTIVAMAALLAACGTIDRCTADTSPPKDGAAQPSPRH